MLAMKYKKIFQMISNDTLLSKYVALKNLDNKKQLKRDMNLSMYHVL